MTNNETVITNAGQYTIIALLGEQYGTDNRHNLAIGRHADGHTDIIVQDNATTWALGNADDEDCNAGQFAALAGATYSDMDAPDLRDYIRRGADMVSEYDEVIRAIDADLADWIAARVDEAIVW